jgi:hypothetical protein
MKYAKNTYVPKEQTMREIRELITKNGGIVHEVTDNNNGKGVVTFLTPGLGVPVRYLVMYDPGATPVEINAKWRAVLLTLKAKFVAVAEGFETAEEVFMSRILQANNAAASSAFLPMILKNSHRDLVKVSRSLDNLRVSETNGWKNLM